MSSAVVDLSVPVEETEAYHELLSRVGKRTGKIPPEVLVRHVLACVPAHEWPTRVEAMDALLRRLESARKDSLRVESRPADGRLLGPVRHPAARLGLAAVSHRLARGRPDRRPVRLPRLREELAGRSASTSWSCSSTCTPARGSCSRRARNRSGATLGRQRACAGTRSGR